MQSPGAGAEEGDHEPPHRLSAAQHAKAGDGWALDRRRTGHSIRDALAENAFPNPDDGDPAGGRPGSPFAYGADGRSRSGDRATGTAALDRRPEPHPLLVDPGVAGSFSQCGGLAGSARSEKHTTGLQSLIRPPSSLFYLNNKNAFHQHYTT